MITVGSGPPLVMIPGLDGHATWLRPAVDALARDFSVTALSLCGERDSGRVFRDSDGFEAQVAQIDDAVRAAQERADGAPVTLCGVSYGGWIALSQAARSCERLAALVLVSSPPPGFVPNQRQRRDLGAPIRSAPAFVLRAPQRIGPEILAALPSWSARLRFLTGHVGRIARTGLSPTRMARRMRLAADVDFFAVCRQIMTPTLIVTGRPGLDRVVPVEETRKYLTLIPGAELVTLHDTGHIGSLTQADRFAEAVAGFVGRAMSHGDRALPRVG